MAGKWSRAQLALIVLLLLCQFYLRVRNPLSSERAYLRQSLLPSLLSTTQANLRFTERVCIFEIGSIYLPIEHEVLPKEPRRLAVVMTGPREERSWLKGQDRTVHGFYDVKGVVEALLRELRLQGEFVAGDYPALHPGRCAQIIIDGETVGFLGELHPSVCEAFDLPSQPVLAMEVDLDVLLEKWGAPHSTVPISVHPPVYEDLAIVVDADTPAATVQRLIIETGGPLARSAILFDVYRGEQLGAGKKSLAYSLTFQAPDKTLDSAHIAKLRERIVQRLAQEHGAALRS